MSEILYIDGNWTVPQPCSEPVLTQPLPGVKDFYLLKQDFVQYGPNAVSAAGKFAPCALNTIYGYDFTSPNTPLFTNYFLTAESPLLDYGAGLVRWTRTYCSKPATRYEATSLRYTYPGYNIAYVVGSTTQAITARLPGDQIATCQLQYDYYLIGSSGAGLATPDLPAFTSIPVISKERWGYNANNGAFFIGFVDIVPPILWDAGISNFIPTGTNGTTDGSTPLSDAAIRALMSAGGIYSHNQSLTSAQYLYLVSLGGFFAAEDSAVSRWQGNIFQRVTKFILAK